MSDDEYKMRIQTHHAGHCPEPWIAIDMDRACDLLDGCDLSDDERDSIPAIMAGYCRLIDEADLIGYGKTEDEATADLKRRLAQ